MPTVLMSAPYMLPEVERFRPVFAHYGIELITTPLRERLEEADLLAYAGQFDATICTTLPPAMMAFSTSSAECTPPVMAMSTSTWP